MKKRMSLLIIVGVASFFTGSILTYLAGDFIRIRKPHCLRDKYDDDDFNYEDD